MVESDQSVFIKEIPPEGGAFKKTVITDEWDFRTAGGCSNFGMFEKNPAYALNFREDSDIMIRLKVLSEIGGDGSTLITDPQKLDFSVSA